MKFFLKIMKHSVQGLSGCLFVMLISSNNFQLMEGYNCTTETIENTLRATCRGDGKKHESGLPKGLSQEIQYLDMSFNIVEGLQNETFAIYPNLIWLSMTDSNFPWDIPFQFLSPLTKLDFLNVTNLYWIDKGVWAWPVNVRIVDATHFTKTENMDISGCEKLEILNASNNELEDIPLMNQLAPLLLVDVSSNPMHSVTAEKLARYCNLREISMSNLRSSTLLSSAKYCDCLRVNTWIKTYQIKISQELPCQSPSGNISCDTTFSANILAIRQDCINLNNQKSSGILKWLLIGGGVFLLLLIIILFITYKYISLEKKVEAGEVEFVEDLSKTEPTPQASAQEEEAEEEQESTT